MSTSERTPIDYFHHVMATMFESMWRDLRLEVEALGKAEPARIDMGPTAAFPSGQFSEVTLMALRPSERRTLVRSIAASIEAMAYCTKSLALDSPNSHELTEGERMLAREEVPKLMDNGSVKEDDRARLRTLPNIRFAFRLLAKAAAAPFALPHDRGWGRLCSTFEVRGRLMHPKTPVDLGVSDAELLAAVEAFLWFETQLLALIGAVLHATDQTLERVEQAWPTHEGDVGQDLAAPDGSGNAGDSSATGSS